MVTPQKEPANQMARDDKQEQLIGRGLYRKVRISVRMLDLLIVIGIAAIIGVLAFGLHHSGYTITYNPAGGSDVKADEISYEYGDLLVLPEEPKREGYEFAGWCLNEACTVYADENTSVEQSMELKADWKPR